MPGESNIIKGSLWALVAFFFMAIFGILTKLALEEGSTIWVSFIAYLTGTLALLPFVIYKGFGTYLKSEHYSYLFGRAIVGCIASFLYTISMHYIPIVNGTLLFNTAPIFIPILAVLWFKVKINTNIWYAVALGFLGIIVIIKPTAAIFTQTGNLIGLVSGLSLAVAYTLMKVLTKTDPGVRIIFYYLGVATLIQVPLLLFGGPIPSPESCFYSILSGAVLLIAQLALVKGYQYAEASQIGIYQYASVVFIGILDWILWGTAPTLFELLGTVLVAIAGIIIIRSGNGTAKARSAES